MPCPAPSLRSTDTLGHADEDARTEPVEQDEETSPPSSRTGGLANLFAAVRSPAALDLWITAGGCG